MDDYLIGMNRDLRMRKVLIATVSSAEFNTMALNSKISKLVSYIQDNKSWGEDLCAIENKISLSSGSSSCR